MKNSLIIIISVLLLSGYKPHESISFYDESISTSHINLNGIWKINTNPPEMFWTLNTLNEEWKDVLVPGECTMQGFSIKHDIPFVYKKSIEIPLEYQNKQIEIQFEGVYSYTRVWVNGKYVRDHSGGFTKWICDITPFVKPGETAMLTVEVTDKADEISYASGYAKHLIGGILRQVNLVAFPTNYPIDVTINTDFDDNFEHATLVVSGKTKDRNQDSEITLELFDKYNKQIHLENSAIGLKGDQTFLISNHIDNPKKWDAEHPNLYTMKISFSENDQLIGQKRYKVGFREITIDGNKLLVNGKEVKLRGACRHDIHPLLGRVSTPEYELKDVILAKEANMNFIRTSHYPPTEHFLQLCDEYGIYVEDETAVCFVNTYRAGEYYPGASESNPNYTDRYMNQLEEMVTSHKNHPSIIMWSIGNENSFGSNFKKSYDWVKANDPTRPVIFSYPGRVPNHVIAYDILSMHYPSIDGTMSQNGKVTKEFGYSQMPVIFDEWAHVPCYNNFTVIEDPNIRSFWGQSLDSMWQKTFDADGGLGGAIWGMIDETFMLPSSLPGFTKNTVGYGEWGIVDTWRRKKPEFWNTKKAYSPVKLLKTKIDNYVEGKILSVPLYNRFDHTNINEMTIKVTHNGRVEELKAPNIAPHTKGLLLIPLNGWKQGQQVGIDFINADKKLIDKYELSINSDTHNKEIIHTLEDILIEENDRFLTLVCENQTKIIINKMTGLFSSIEQDSKKYLFSGPYLNLRTKGDPIKYSYHTINEYGKGWQLKNMNYKNEGKKVSIALSGIYNNAISAEYQFLISSNGEIQVLYQIKNIPHENIREIGIKFELDDAYDALSWVRKSYWSYYPKNHLSSTKGIASLYSHTQKHYRIEPQKDWNQDAKSFYYNGIEDELTNQLTNITKATKENIRKYSLLNNKREMISVLSNGDVSARLSKVEDKIYLYANSEIDYVDLSWGNFQKNILLENAYNNKMVIEINTHSSTMYK